MSRAAGQILEWCQTEPGMLDSSAPEALITAEAHLGEAHQIVNVAVRECRVGFARNLRVTPLPELAT